MTYLEKLHAQERFDITLEAKGQGPDGIAVLAKLETFDEKDGKLLTVRKISVLASAKTIKGAQNKALKEAVELLGL